MRRKFEKGDRVGILWPSTKSISGPYTVQAQQFAHAGQRAYTSTGQRVTFANNMWVYQLDLLESNGNLAWVPEGMLHPWWDGNYELERSSYTFEQLLDSLKNGAIRTDQEDDGYQD